MALDTSNSIIEALLESQNRRIFVLEEMIEKKKKKKSDAVELLKKQINLNNDRFEKHDNVLLDVLEKNNSRSSGTTVIPSPS